MQQLESLSIEALAELRDDVTARLADRVAARQRELQAEQGRIGGLVGAKAAKPNGKRAPKYRKGDETWSGAGISRSG